MSKIMCSRKNVKSASTARHQKALITGLAIAVTGAIAYFGTHAATPAPNLSLLQKLKTDPSYRGLHLAQTGPCKGLLELDNRPGMCTHGPDPETVGRGVNLVPNFPVRAGAVNCYGDGRDGDRVQVIYAHTPSQPDRFSTLTTNFQTASASIDGIISGSAAETGGSAHIRYLTDAACNVVVQNVTLPRETDRSNMHDSIDDLTALGFNRLDRDYVVWMEGWSFSGGCIATVINDDRLVGDNLGKYFSLYAFCSPFDGAMAHEFVHTTGAVQNSAPHASGNSHCWDSADLMCYNDGGPYFTSGGSMKLACQFKLGHSSLDCDHDDYFFAGTPPAGNYLASHWNTAFSRWLENPVRKPWPGAPTNLRIQALINSSQLTWNAPNEPNTAAVVGYDIYRNSKLIGQTTTTSFTDDFHDRNTFDDVNRTTGSTDYYDVKARSSSGTSTQATSSAIACKRRVETVANCNIGWLYASGPVRLHAEFNAPISGKLSLYSADGKLISSTQGISPLELLIPNLPQRDPGAVNPGYVARFEPDAASTIQSGVVIGTVITAQYPSP